MKKKEYKPTKRNKELLKKYLKDGKRETNR